MRYLVACRYEGSAVNLQTFGENVIIDFSSTISGGEFDFYSANSPLSSVLPSNNPNDAVILRFRDRTAWTVGTPDTVKLYAEAVPRLAVQYDFLLHAVLAFTFLHDRSLAGSALPAPSESHHMSQSAALLNRRLSSRILDDERDALWATAAYLCAMSVFTVNTTDPYEAWPLTESNSDSLKWLKLQAGLRVMWQVANLDRDEGVFGHLERKGKVNCVYPAPPEPGINGLPRLFAKLCDLSSSSNADHSPYHTALRHLTWLLSMEGTPENVLSFMVFIGGMTSSFRTLLHDKDPRALLLMAVWYSKLYHSAWWMAARARVECQAIIIYLGRLRIYDLAFNTVLAVVREASTSLKSETANCLLHAEAQHSESQLQIPDGPKSRKSDLSWLDI